MEERNESFCSQLDRLNYLWKEIISTNVALDNEYIYNFIENDNEKKKNAEFTFNTLYTC